VGKERRCTHSIESGSGAVHPSLRNSTPNLCADADIDRVVVQCMHRNTSKERLSLVLKLSNSPVLKKFQKIYLVWNIIMAGS